MGMVDALKAGGFVAEKSEIGGKRILTGIYKAVFTAVAKQEDKGYGESIRADFKIEEKMSGDDSNSKFPEFVGFFNTSADKILSKRNGLAKLICGLFSVGYEVNQTSDEALMASLEAGLGTTVYISAYKQKPQKKEGDVWVENPDGENKQAFTFMTEKNAVKEAEKKVKQGNF